MIDTNPISNSDEAFRDTEVFIPSGGSYYMQGGHRVFQKSVVHAENATSAVFIFVYEPSGTSFSPEIYGTL